MNRGARRQGVFSDDRTRELFLDLVSDFPGRFGVRVHAYALMPNHYHLLLESVHGQLSRAMRHLGGEFTRRMNAMHGWDGALFRGRYKNRLVDADEYWQHLLVYIHLNPVRAGISTLGEARWTSHKAYIGEADRPTWLDTSDLQRMYGTREDYIAYYRETHDGKRQPPAGFDASQLWRPQSTGAVAVPHIREPLWRLAKALEDVSNVTGQAVEELLVSPRGRKGNPANWLTAWWLSRGCFISHGRIADVMGASHATISKRIHRVERRLGRDEQLTSWASSLRDRQDDGA